MAAAHYTIDVTVVGHYLHRRCGLVVAFTLSSDPNVIHLAFAEG